jgi:hypothetical protein
MALINLRNRWVNLAAPLVLFVAVFTGVLVLIGDSFGHAIGFSLTFYVAVALLDGWHGRRSDVKRRRAPVAECPSSVVRIPSR